MISVRTHLVTLVAVFLALAVGVVLGGGPLSDVGDSQPVSSAEAPPPTGASGYGSGSGAGDAFAGAVASRVLAERLDDRPVAVVALPGAEEDVLDALAGRIDQAGGRVVRSYGVTPTLLRTGEKQLVDTLGRQLVAEYAKGEVDGAAPPYERLGRLLALSVATTDRSGDAVDQRAASVLASLAEADVVSVGKEPRRRAPLVLVVLGDEPVDVVLPPEDRTSADVEELEASTDAILAGLLDGLRDGSAGVLLAASAASGADGTLSRLRENGGPAGVSTLDGVDTEVGQVSVPLGLQRALRGRTGAYGAAGADGAVPLG